MVSYLQLGITKEELYAEVSKVVDENGVRALKKRGTEYFKELADVHEKDLFDKWVEILGKRTAFKVFPFLIATCERQDTCKILDEFMYKEMLKLPKKHKGLIFDMKTYFDLFSRLYQEVELNIIKRIKQDKIDYKAKNYVMDPSRIFQLIQIIRRLGTYDLSSFKFAMNFGLTPHTKDLLINEILIKDPANTQEVLDKVEENEIFILLKYLETCKHKEEKKLENR